MLVDLRKNRSEQTIGEEKKCGGLMGGESENLRARTLESSKKP